ncbi:putative inactive receptor-like protein kinase At1g64210 [Rhodamnia argentea]|uniref:Inactive receptor-like protein kinase At1g64210 n=1 Tax=Rhodamnia argentea TaxID=178133 RepID=A0A8B8Q323_9MYRT|nr:putative inactive receptor-like protein kinase At1g64210 [Rhodamnia argentea]
MQSSGVFASRFASRQSRSIVAIFLLIITITKGELSETESFLGFIRAVDPENATGFARAVPFPYPCSANLKGVSCDLEDGRITEIRLQHLSLKGTIDAKPLCELPNLRYLSLANNLIRGNIPASIENCTGLITLNLSSNLLSGRVPAALRKLKLLSTVDISNNSLSVTAPNRPKFIPTEKKRLDSHHKQIYVARHFLESRKLSNAESPESGGHDTPWYHRWGQCLPLVFGVGFFFLLTWFVGKKAAKLAEEKAILKALSTSPLKVLTPNPLIEEIKPEEGRSELVFFVEEHEAFKLDDLLEAAADLQSQRFRSSLYKVVLKNNIAYAVKRLKKLRVSFEEFGNTLRQVGNMKHPNILPLVGFNSTNEDKLLIYKYQSNGSLLNLCEDYIAGKRDFPWKLRLYIAGGIARGLGFIYERTKEREIIPHGNLKLSNILLGDSMEALISEYGVSKFIDPKVACVLGSNGYMAPEKCFSEQADVYSLGVIMLELLTGKLVKKTGVNLPKWVKSMVREEWTGEVFDKEVSKAAKQWAFPLLNISLKCVADAPDKRPSITEVMEKIEEVIKADQNHLVSDSPMRCAESNYQDCCFLHSVIPETWDTPGSNY